jgi:hypothetical protein
MQRLMNIFKKKNPLPKIVVLSNHKCGTTWTASLLKNTAKMNNWTYQRSDTTSNFKLESDVCFFANSSYADLKNAQFERALNIIRNPLSVIVSAYYSHLASHSTDGWPALELHRKILQSCTKEQGMFLTLSQLERASTLNAFANWNFGDPRITTVCFEDFTGKAEAVFASEVRANGVTEYKFPNMKWFSFEEISGGRKIGEVDDSSHFRSGDPEGWRSELPKPILDYMRNYYGQFLEAYYPSSMKD